VPISNTFKTEILIYKIFHGISKIIEMAVLIDD